MSVTSPSGRCLTQLPERSFYLHLWIRTKLNARDTIAGVTWYDDDNLALTASFAGSPAGVAPFAIQAQMDELNADVAAGLEMINAADSGLRLYYDGHFGDTTWIHSVGLKGSAKF